MDDADPGSGGCLSRGPGSDPGCVVGRRPSSRDELDERGVAQQALLTLREGSDLRIRRRRDPGARRDPGPRDEDTMIAAEAV